MISHPDQVVNIEQQTINVLVVDDSALVREVMTAILSKEPRIRVTTAADPLIAMQKMAHQRPTVILLDLEMPRMDGLEFLRRVMSTDPIPVVVCSGLAARGTRTALRALEEGAVEVIVKPKLGVGSFLHESAVQLIDAVCAAATSKIPRASQRRTDEGPSFQQHIQPQANIPTNEIVAIGASTGGTEALRAVLEALPVDSPAILIVQHMPAMFTRAFADRLNQDCRIKVKEAEDGDSVVSGQALIAPGNRHMALRKRGNAYSVVISDGPLVSRHRPSVDVLFRSVAEAAGPNAIGVIMTGMGQDGAEGLVDMRKAGAFTLAQDEATSIVFGMPREAILRGAANRVVPLHSIANSILEYHFQRQVGAL